MTSLSEFEAFARASSKPWTLGGATGTSWLFEARRPLARTRVALGNPSFRFGFPPTPSTRFLHPSPGSSLRT